MSRPGSRRQPPGTADDRKGEGRTHVKSSRTEPRVLTAIRLRPSLRRDLEATDARTRRSLAEVAQELIEEALRMRHCPGIYFADEPSGRTAKVGGTGLGVWEVVRDFNRNHDTDRIRKVFPQLSRAQITAALMYQARYREEIQAKIHTNAALTPEAIEKQYPSLVHFTR